MNTVVAALRGRGGLIIHAPGDCMAFYAHAPARQRARSASFAAAPVPFAWQPWNPDREGELPRSLVDPGPCSCEMREPCGTGQPPYPWTRQIAAIDVADQDAVSDDGQEIWNLLEGRRITDVVVIGVHTNICVLSRPYGIRQLVYLGKRPVLCGDLTDAFHRDPRGHAWGTAITLDHVAQYWCPVKSSAELLAAG